jgi:hypothetical protein
MKTSSKPGSAVLAVLLPIVVACLCILLSVALVISLHYHPYIYWNLHAVAWGVIALSLAMFPRYLNAYAPMLLMWAFWFSLQGEIATYWVLVDKGIAGPVGFSTELYQLSVAGMLLLSVCLHLQALRGRLPVLLSAILYMFLVCVVPKPRVAKELLILQQIIAYTLLYLVGHVVLEVYALHQREKGPIAIAKLLYASWALWIPQTEILVAASSVHLLISLGVLLSRWDDFWLFYTSRQQLYQSSTVSDAVNSVEDPERTAAGKQD